LGLILKHITTLAEVPILSIYHHLDDIWFFTGDISKILSGLLPPCLVY
jgi:hypothetical protein